MGVRDKLPAYFLGVGAGGTPGLADSSCWRMNELTLPRQALHSPDSYPSSPRGGKTQGGPTLRIPGRQVAQTWPV